MTCFCLGALLALSELFIVMARRFHLLEIAQVFCLSMINLQRRCFVIISLVWILLYYFRFRNMLYILLLCSRNTLAIVSAYCLALFHIRLVLKLFTLPLICWAISSTCFLNFIGGVYHWLKPLMLLNIFSLCYALFRSNFILFVRFLLEMIRLLFWHRRCS